MKKVLVFQGLISGERGGIRTLGHLIKSQVLYQLSYALCSQDRRYFKPVIKKCQSFFQKNAFLFFMMTFVLFSAIFMS